jgi:RNA polymerase sigma factor (sigma-70 family)
LIRALSILTLALMNLVQPVDLPDDDDDDHLIERIVATGNQQVFRVLHDRHSRAISAQLCAWARSRQIEDVAQETWAKIYQNLEKCWPGRFRAWAFTIARHCFIDSVRRRRPVVLKEGAQYSDLSWEEALERSRESEQTRILRECISKLQERHRAVINMRFYEEADYKTLCEKLGISRPEAHRLKHEAVQHLTKCCERAKR